MSDLSNKSISYKQLNKLAIKEMNHFDREHKTNGEVALKCLMFDVNDYLSEQTKNNK